MASSEDAQTHTAFKMQLSIIARNHPTALRIHGLLDSLVSNLEEFYDKGTNLELELAALPTLEGLIVNSELRLRDVVAFVKEKVRTCASELMSNHLVQNLLPSTNHPTPHVQTSAENQIFSKPLPRGTTSRSDSNASKRAGRGGLRVDVSRKALCPRPWSTLPVEVVELVVSRLPLPHVVELCKSLEALSKSSNFLKACAKRYPKLVGLSDWDFLFKSRRTTVYDIESREWVSVEFGVIPEKLFKSESCVSYRDEDLALDLGAFEDAMFALDGGLVCYVHRYAGNHRRILVCNPLTNVWKFLSPLRFFSEKEIVLVQLLMDDDGEGYKIILVANEASGFSACVYCSKSEDWEMMDSGLVYGDGRQLSPYSWSVPYIFDCTTGVLHDLRQCRSFQSCHCVSFAMTRGQVLVVYDDGDDPDHVRFSEFSWDSSESNLKTEGQEIEHDFDPEFCDTIYRDPIVLLASGGFALMMRDNLGLRRSYREQLMEFHDLSAKTFHTPPDLNAGNIYPCEEFRKLAMSELRWDVSP